MATMIPEKPHQFDPASQEGLMFEAFEKLHLVDITHTPPLGIHLYMTKNDKYFTFFLNFF